MKDTKMQDHERLLYGNKDTYGIYQLKEKPELRELRFMGTEALKRMGLTGHDLEVIKAENYDLLYVGELTDLKKQAQDATLEAIYEKFNIDHPADFKGHSLSVSDIVVLHEEGVSSAHFVDSYGFTMLPEFMKELEGKEQETELAFAISDRYIVIQETDEGYDYTIIGTDYKEIDGGAYDNPDVTIREALKDIVDDLKSEPDHNGAKGNIREDDELMPIDFDGLMEKVEAANRIEPQSSVEAARQAQAEAAKKEAEVTLMVSECSEFHDLGEFYENIPTVEEAIAIWKQIPPERLNGIPAIGINIHRPGEERYMDDEIDLLIGNCIDLEMLEYCPGIASEPKAVEIIAELIAKLPEMEINGNMSEELLEKLAEYQSLTRSGDNAINGMEDMLNNGAGGKAQKGAAKREQEPPAVRTSLKARLAEKKAQTAGRETDHSAQEKDHNNRNVR